MDVSQNLTIVQSFLKTGGLRNARRATEIKMKYKVMKPWSVVKNGSENELRSEGLQKALRKEPKAGSVLVIKGSIHRNIEETKS